MGQEDGQVEQVKPEAKDSQTLARQGDTAGVSPGPERGNTEPKQGEVRHVQWQGMRRWDCSSTIYSIQGTRKSSSCQPAAATAAILPVLTERETAEKHSLWAGVAGHHFPTWTSMSIVGLHGRRSHYPA